jgi:AcrR family transcriptional regulator
MASTTTTDKRTRLIQAAARLVHQQGFAHTSLADIAKDAKVPLGNVYYYFKTKDEIADAVIEQYLQQFHTLCEHLTQMESPRERLCAFVQMTLSDRTGIAEHGCPLGTLCSELCKDTGVLAKRSGRLFAESLSWLESQFKAFTRKSDARGLAVHLLSTLQGVTVLAHALKDTDLVGAEADRLKAWIQNL